MVLLDRKIASLDFQPAAVVTAGMTLGGGQLSGLTVNGREVPTGPGGPFSGGRLAAAFAFRDRDGPAVQAALDTLAQSLIARVEGPPTDPSAAPGAPGLFTDAGTALSPPPAPGLAGRLALNPLVDPAAGGALWRLRDGLGAAGPGPVGDPSQLVRWIEALDRPVASGPGTPLRALGAEVDALLSAVGQSNQAATDRVGYARALETGLSERALAGGVDIDAEMRRLVAIETAYAANARVIQVADEMLKRLLEI
jgi:flagellar hook-associated protein 1 FlgK